MAKTSKITRSIADREKDVQRREKKEKASCFRREKKNVYAISAKKGKSKGYVFANLG